MKITDTIKYVGVNDHQVDLFHDLPSMKRYVIRSYDYNLIFVVG